jgi:glycosidase
MKYFLASLKKLNTFEIDFSGVKEFHISKAAREKYNIDKTFFKIRGNIIFSDSFEAKLFADKLNKENIQISPSEVFALGLLDEVKHLLITLYKQQENDKIFKNAIKYLNNKIGKEKLLNTVSLFTLTFPPDVIFTKKTNITNYLQKDNNLEAQLEEMLILRLNNLNPAYEKIRHLFDDKVLFQTAYSEIFDNLLTFFSNQKQKKIKENLFEMLIEPQKAEPYNIFKQLRFIKDKWGFKLNEIENKILLGLDLIKEETKPRLNGPAPAEVIKFESNFKLEEEKYSKDSNWMPETVMIAKSTFVWLYQLSKKYRFDISSLNSIPMEELISLKQQGFNALWLIGVWERSKASKRIKELCGNPEATASAYSIFDYKISSNLGGEESFKKFKKKCQKVGLRLAADMVPNHFGIDSKWVHKYPERFLSVKQPPYPSYSFNGENLSTDSSLEIKIEDHYYDKTDAAVVFERKNLKTGERLYIYHGNDGTSMPWNDTAQLDYTKKEVRDAIIETIIEIAKEFPIIRFDAAMTLAKKHYKRLWFPSKGEGGDIPTRSDYSMTEKEFNKLMPKEFFREVVDAVKEKAPDTLLLAEAFWLMEGYFVRTLGMHRVYNSAFMNMLKNEENQKYRESIKNILMYDRRILKRFVNFLSNPDEEPAVMGFGKDDKYFGCCILLATMPGLPMFAHGQIEGFAEKYGMEYKKAYKKESADLNFVKRHEREIFPLLKVRKAFAEVENFYLYDFKTDEKSVDENVFAYSNKYKNSIFIVLFNNKFSETKGFIDKSVPFLKDNRVETYSISNLLNIKQNDNSYIIFKDLISGNQFIRSGKEILGNGLTMELQAFKYLVLGEFKLVFDETGLYKQVNEKLKGKCVFSIEEEVNKIKYQELYKIFENILKLKNPDNFKSQLHIFLNQLSKNGIEVKPENKEFVKRKASLILNSKCIKNKELYFAFCLVAVETLIKNEKILNLLNFRKTINKFNKHMLKLEALKEVIEVFENGDVAGLSVFFNKLFKKNKVKSYLQFNKYEGIVYFNKEKFEILSKYIACLFSQSNDDEKKIFALLNNAALLVGYKAEKFIIVL